MEAKPPITIGYPARSSPEKRKELFHLLLVRLAAILADLKGLRESDLFRSFFPVVLAEHGAESIGRRREEARPLIADCFLPRSHRGRVGGVGDQVGSSVAAAFVEESRRTS